MHLDQLPERIHSSLDQLRERTAEVVAPDEEGVLRRIGLLESRLEDIGQTITSQLDAVASEQEEHWRKLLSTRRRTTWPRRVFWLLVGAAAGAGAAYLTDPDRGRSRRARMSDQLAARARDVGGDLATQAKITADRVRGTAAEAVRGALPEDVPDDPKLLEQRIRSQVFGHRDDVAEVVLRIDGPGQVAVKGTVPSPVNERELLAAIAEVEGVVDVRSELSVRAG